jgi:hypothetical protein
VKGPSQKHEESQTQYLDPHILARARECRREVMEEPKHVAYYESAALTGLSYRPGLIPSVAQPRSMYVPGLEA